MQAGAERLVGPKLAVVLLLALELQAGKQAGVRALGQRSQLAGEAAELELRGGLHAHGQVGAAEHVEEAHGGEVEQVGDARGGARRGDAGVDVVAALGTQFPQRGKAVGRAVLVARVDVDHEVGKRKGVVDGGVALWGARRILGLLPGIVDATQRILQGQIATGRGRGVDVERVAATSGVEQSFVLTDDLLLHLAVEDGVGDGVEHAFFTEADAAPALLLAVLHELVAPAEYCDTETVLPAVCGELGENGIEELWCTQRIATHNSHLVLDDKGDGGGVGPVHKETVRRVEDAAMLDTAVFFEERVQRGGSMHVCEADDAAECLWTADGSLPRLHGRYRVE